MQLYKHSVQKFHLSPLGQNLVTWPYLAGDRGCSFKLLAEICTAENQDFIGKDEERMVGGVVNTTRFCVPIIR